MRGEARRRADPGPGFLSVFYLPVSFLQLFLLKHFCGSAEKVTSPALVELEVPAGKPDLSAQLYKHFLFTSL